MTKDYILCKNHDLGALYFKFQPLIAKNYRKACQASPDGVVQRLMPKEDYFSLAWDFLEKTVNSLNWSKVDPNTFGLYVRFDKYLSSYTLLEVKKIFADHKQFGAALYMTDENGKEFINPRSATYMKVHSVEKESNKNKLYKMLDEISKMDPKYDAFLKAKMTGISETKAQLDKVFENKNVFYKTKREVRKILKEMLNKEALVFTDF